MKRNISHVLALKQTDDRLRKYEEKLDILKNELEQSNNSLMEAKKKEASMQKEATVQANFSAAMGSVMGTMLWRTSKTEDVINLFIKEVS